MAISDWIPEVWAARFTRRLRDQLVWGNFVDRSYAPMVVSYGDTIHIPTFSKSTTMRDYTVATDIAAPERATGDKIDMEINKQKYFNIAVDDINAVQSRPNILDEFMTDAAFQSAKVIDTDIKAEFVTNYLAARENEVTGTLEAPAFGSNFLKALAKTKRQMDEANIPAQGRWMITHPQVIEAMEVWLLANPIANLYIPATTEQALRNGFSGTLLGIQVYSTTTAYDATVSSTQYWRTVIGQSNTLVAHAAQISSIEPYRIENQFGDAVKGLYVYGTKTIEGTSLHFVRTAKAA